MTISSASKDVEQSEHTLLSAMDNEYYSGIKRMKQSHLQQHGWT